MRRAVLIIGIALLACRSIGGQTLPSVELFGGYSNFWENKQHVHGWNASAAKNANRWLSVVGDVSVHYFPEETFVSAQTTEKSSIDQYRFYVGPQFSIRRLPRITPSFRLLLGVVHTRTEFSGVTVPGYPFSNELVPFSGSRSTNDFSGAVGALVDIKASERIAFRIIQADYIRENTEAIRPEGLRIGLGVVVGLGRK